MEHARNEGVIRGDLKIYQPRELTKKEKLKEILRMDKMQVVV